MSPLFDRDKPGVTKSQTGFFDFVVFPLFGSFVRVFPACKPLLLHAEHNYAYWQSLTSPSPSSAAAPGAQPPGGTPTSPAGNPTSWGQQEQLVQQGGSSKGQKERDSGTRESKPAMTRIGHALGFSKPRRAATLSAEGLRIGAPDPRNPPPVPRPPSGLISQSHVAVDIAPRTASVSLVPARSGGSFVGFMGRLVGGGGGAAPAALAAGFNTPAGRASAEFVRPVAGRAAGFTPHASGLVTAPSNVVAAAPAAQPMQRLDEDGPLRLAHKHEEPRDL